MDCFKQLFPVFNCKAFLFFFFLTQCLAYMYSQVNESNVLLPCEKKFFFLEIYFALAVRVLTLVIVSLLYASVILSEICFFMTYVNISFSEVVFILLEHAWLQKVIISMTMAMNLIFSTAFSIQPFFLSVLL